MAGPSCSGRTFGTTIDIPAERMKMGKPHCVFLSPQAVELLRQVHKISGHGEYVVGARLLVADSTPPAASA